MSIVKHFAEEGGSCFIGEHQYTLKQLVEMEMTTLDADVALEMLDNPKKPNDKLMELLEGK